MDGIVRRPSGVYVARVSVPERLRHVVGKTELIASTGVRDLPVARIVGGYQLATWRQRFLELGRTLDSTLGTSSRSHIGWTLTDHRRQ